MDKAQATAATAGRRWWAAAHPRPSAPAAPWPRGAPGPASATPSRRRPARGAREGAGLGAARCATGAAPRAAGPPGAGPLAGGRPAAARPGEARLGQAPPGAARESAGDEEGTK